MIERCSVHLAVYGLYYEAGSRFSHRFMSVCVVHKKTIAQLDRPTDTFNPFLISNPGIIVSSICPWVVSNRDKFRLERSIARMLQSFKDRIETTAVSVDSRFAMESRRILFISFQKINNISVIENFVFYLLQ